jgi:hypothetical protein
MTGPYLPHARDAHGRPIRLVWLAVSKRPPTLAELRVVDVWNTPGNDNGRKRP